MGSIYVVLDREEGDDLFVTVAKAEGKEVVLSPAQGNVLFEGLKQALATPLPRGDRDQGAPN